jgi:chemotaxis methyl-accepting protein methylase
MDMISRLAGKKDPGACVAVTVLACSKGAEVYSILWSIRGARPDLKITLQAVDISQEIIDFGKEGAYSLKSARSLNSRDNRAMTDEERLTWITCRDQGPHLNSSIFERLNQSEMDEMFDWEGDRGRIKPWLKEGITWRLGDASAPALVDALGSQDIVVANRFLCHMEPPTAEKCLRNLSRLVKPGGYLFVSGVDLDVRTKVARELGWKPVQDRLREVYEGDFSLAMGWPLEWWAVEPFSDNYADWGIRYACIFQIGEAPSSNRTGDPTQLLGSTR